MPILSVNEENKKVQLNSVQEHVCDKLSDRRENSSDQKRKPITDSPVLPADEEHEKEQHQKENADTCDKILDPSSTTSTADGGVESPPSPLDPPTRPAQAVNDRKSPSLTQPPSRPITATATATATADSSVRRRNRIRSARKTSRDYSDNKEDDNIEQMLVDHDNKNQTQPKQQDGKMHQTSDANVEDEEEEDYDEYNSGLWSEKEHERLVKAFSKFGRAPQKIQSYVRTRSIRGISSYISRHYENILRDSKKYKNHVEDNNVEEEEGPSDNSDEEEEEDHDNNDDNDNDNEYNSGLWSEKEHKRLVEAFSKFGRTSSKLQPYVKTRSINGIKSYINRHYEKVLRDIKKYKDRVKNNTEKDEPSLPATAAAATNMNRPPQIATSPKKRKLQSTTNNKNNKKTRQVSDEKKTSPVSNEEPTIKQEAESKVSMHESETTTSETISNAHLASSKQKQRRRQINNEKETENDKTISVTNDEQESKTTTDEESKATKHEPKEESAQDPKQEVKDESSNNNKAAENEQAGDDQEIEVIYIDMSDESIGDNSEAAKESEIKTEDKDDDDGPQIIDVDISDVSIGGDDRVSSISKTETAFSNSRNATAIRIVRGTHEVTLPPLSVRKCTDGNDVLKASAKQSVLDKSHLFIFSSDIKKDIGNEKKVVRYEFRGQNPTSAQFKLLSMDDILQGNANDDTVLITMSINEVDEAAGKVTLDACCF